MATLPKLTVLCCVVLFALGARAESNFNILAKLDSGPGNVTRSTSIFRESRNGIHPISAAKNLLAVNAFGSPDSSSVRHDAQLPYGTLHITAAPMT